MKRLFLFFIISIFGSCALYASATETIYESYDTIYWSPSYSFQGYEYPIPSPNGYEHLEYIDYVLECRDKQQCSIHRLYLAIRPDISSLAQLNSVSIAEQCADSGLIDIFLEVNGLVNQIKLSFSKQAQQAGLSDTILPLPTDGTLTIPYNDVRAGIHHATLSGLYYSVEVFRKDIDLIFLYPSSVIEQRWNDVMTILTYDYNGGYNFTSFQWYKNGEILNGENHSYLHSPIEIGAEYSALLTDNTGLQLMTCPLVACEHTDITIYPTIRDNKQYIICKVSMPAKLYLYDINGSVLSVYSFVPGENEINLPNKKGIYIAKIVTDNQQKVVRKLFVQ